MLRALTVALLGTALAGCVQMQVNNAQVFADQAKRIAENCPAAAEAAAQAQAAAASTEEGVRAEALLLGGESDLKLRRLPAAAKAFEAVGTVANVEAGVRYRALAGLGLTREQQRSWKAALAAYEAVASRSPDATLRDWAQERAKAVRGRMNEKRDR